MLFMLLIVPFFAIANWVVSLLPTVAAPPGMVTAISSTYGIIRSLGLFIPLDVFFSVISIVFSVYALQFFVSAANWVIRKIPTIS
jgi:hypothetical protein